MAAAAPALVESGPGSLTADEARLSGPAGGAQAIHDRTNGITELEAVHGLGRHTARGLAPVLPVRQTPRRARSSVSRHSQKRSSPCRSRLPRKPCGRVRRGSSRCDRRHERRRARAQCAVDRRQRDQPRRDDTGRDPQLHDARSDDTAGTVPARARHELGTESGRGAVPGRIDRAGHDRVFPSARRERRGPHHRFDPDVTTTSPPPTVLTQPATNKLARLVPGCGARRARDPPPGPRVAWCSGPGPDRPQAGCGQAQRQLFATFVTAGVMRGNPRRVRHPVPSRPRALAS